MATLADHRYDQLAWVKKVLRLGLSDDTDDGEDQAATVDAARRGEAPAPIRWELARDGDPGVPNRQTRLLRMISTRIQQRAALANAQAAGPPGPDLSATDSATVACGQSGGNVGTHHDRGVGPDVAA